MPTLVRLLVVCLVGQQDHIKTAEHISTNRGLRIGLDPEQTQLMSGADVDNYCLLLSAILVPSALVHCHVCYDRSSSLL